MILAKLRGGLSNQMFQYAAARRLAERHGTAVRIDTHWYDHIPPGATPREYELDGTFTVTGARATAWETIGTDGVRNTPPALIPLALYRKVRPRYRFVAERAFEFDPSILELPDRVCLFGYFVSEKYFVDIADIVRREFTFIEPPTPESARLLQDLADGPSVAIHVRRGDYAAVPEVAAIHGLCGLDYYEAAIGEARRCLPDARFFVFSDDLAWAGEHLPVGRDAVFVDHNRGQASPQDLRLMAAASHNVIANSGFSWWAAWLNPNPEKFVWAPRRWMNDPSIKTDDVLPDGWIAL